jgi:hypothetical protein
MYLGEAMAGNTFEERLTRLEEQFKALQALTQGLAAWEMGAISAPDPDKHAQARLGAREPAALESGPANGDRFPRDTGEPSAR